MKKNRESVVKFYTTSLGELTGFVGIVTPSTKFDSKGIYSANVLVSKEEGEKLLAAVKEVGLEQYKKYGNKTQKQQIKRVAPYTIVTKNEEGDIESEVPDEEERYIVKASSKAFIENGKPKRIIPIFDAKGHPIQASNILLGEGSKVKLNLSLEGYTVGGKTGVSVKLMAVQVVELKEYRTTSAASFGFDETDGYEYSEETITADPDSGAVEDEELGF